MNYNDVDDNEYPKGKKYYSDEKRVTLYELLDRRKYISLVFHTKFKKQNYYVTYTNRNGSWETIVDSIFRIKESDLELIYKDYLKNGDKYVMSGTFSLNASFI